MLPAIHARRPRQTHRAGRLSEEHASADVTRADGGRNGESNRRTTQSSNRDRHSARPEALNARLLSERKYNRHQISPRRLAERRISSLPPINWLALGDYFPTAEFDLLFSSCLA